MLPFDPTAAIVFGTMLVALVLSLLYAAWYQSMKLKTKRGSTDLSNSVGLKELESMMRRTLNEALAPIEDRVDAIDDRIRSIQKALGPAAAENPALTEHRESTPVEERTGAVKGTLRSR